MCTGRKVFSVYFVLVNPKDSVCLVYNIYYIGYCIEIFKENRESLKYCSHNSCVGGYLTWWEIRLVVKYVSV